MFGTIWCADAIFLQNLEVQLTLGEGVVDCFEDQLGHIDQVTNYQTYKGLLKPLCYVNPNAFNLAHYLATEGCER